MTIEDDDVRLVEACRRGDINAFESLVLRHQRKMLNVSFRIVGDYDDACEVTQDAFVAAYKGLNDFRGNSRFSTWLTSITMNLSRNKIAANASRNRNISVDNPGEEKRSAQFAAASTASDAEEELQRFDVREKVRQCMENLTPEYREVIVLRDVEEYSYEEISAILHLAGGTVKSRIARAREGMKDCLKKWTGLL